MRFPGRATLPYIDVRYTDTDDGHGRTSPFRLRYKWAVRMF